jgi:hypothetical protein
MEEPPPNLAVPPPQPKKRGRKPKNPATAASQQPIDLTSTEAPPQNLPIPPSMKKRAIAAPPATTEPSATAAPPATADTHLDLRTITDSREVQSLVEQGYKTCYPPDRCFERKRLYWEITDRNNDNVINRINNYLFSLAPYNEEMREAILYYGSGSGFNKMNRQIYSKTGERYPGGNDLLISRKEKDLIKSHIANLDEAFRTAAPRYNDTIVVFRGTHRPYRHLNNIGDMEEIPPYISTSRDANLAFNFSDVLQKGFVDDACCIYIFLISPGIPYIDFLSARLGIYQYEMEILLPRNLVLKYEGDVLLDTTKINFMSSPETSKLLKMKKAELDEKVMNGEITQEISNAQYLDYNSSLRTGVEFTDTECKSEFAAQIQKLAEEANNLAIINEFDLSRLSEPVKRTLGTKLMNKFQGIKDFFAPSAKRRDPVNTLTPEGKYKIKVVSVHAKPDNIYGIRPSTDPAINSSNIGGKRKTRKTRKNNKRYTRRNN